MNRFFFPMVHGILLINAILLITNIFPSILDGLVLLYLALHLPLFGHLATKVVHLPLLVAGVARLAAECFHSGRVAGACNGPGAYPLGSGILLESRNHSVLLLWSFLDVRSVHWN